MSGRTASGPGRHTSRPDPSGAAFAGMFRAKVGGAWTLHRLCEGRILDAFVLFSSTTSLLGVAGLVTNAGLAVLARNLYLLPDVDARRDFVALQYAVHDVYR